MITWEEATTLLLDYLKKDEVLLFKQENDVFDLILNRIDMSNDFRIKLKIVTKNSSDEISKHTSQRILNEIFKVNKEKLDTIYIECVFFKCKKQFEKV